MLKYRLKKLSRKKTIVWTTILLLFAISMASIVRYYAVASFAGVDLDTLTSNVTSTTVTINDLQSDYDYYMGLNYTEFTSKTTLPGNASINKYSDDTLVAVQLIYDGRDIDDNTIRGTVSTASGEGQYIYKYYKYYPVEDGKIKIELIDNPFSNRPSGKGFNGWVCNPDGDPAVGTTCDSVEFSYDDDYYTRYLTVPATGGDSITIYLNASWQKADIRTSLSGFKDKSMQNITDIHTLTLTYQYRQVHYTFERGNSWITWSGRYIHGTLGEMPTDPHYVITPDWCNPANLPYWCNRQVISLTGNEVIVYIVEDNQYSLQGTTHDCPYGKTCWYYEIVNQNEDFDETAPYSYYFTNGSGEAVAITSENEDTYLKILSDTTQTITVELGKIADDVEITNLESYFYQIGELTTAQKNSGLYYGYTGLNCKDGGCSGNSNADSGYKLIQHTDTAYQTLPAEAFDPVDLSPYSRTFIVDEIKHKLTIQGCHLDDVAVDCNDYPQVHAESYVGVIARYKYLVTRDTNIYQGNINGDTINVPLTQEGGTFRNGTINDDYGFVRGTLQSNFSADNNNVKIGRGVTAGSTRIVYGGSNSGDNMKLIIESGTYSEIQNVYGNNGSSLEAKYVYGSDYDRAKNDNSKLVITYQISASKSGNAENSGLVPSSAMTIKSGRYGTDVTSSNYNRNNSYYVYGIYVGALTAGNNTALRTVTVEGGEIFNLIGGPCIAENYEGNVIGMYIKGGLVANIVGGAGASRTYGNRLISVTGGQVTNSVAGGSNSYFASSAANPDAMYGNTLVYIGGHAVIGNGANVSSSHNPYGWYNHTWYEVILGSVYGAGLGNTSNTDLGVVNNSHVVINGGTIYGSVFGGGNFGTTGLKSDNLTKATVDLRSGTINGDVYGAGNNSGGGKNVKHAVAGLLRQPYYTGVEYVSTPTNRPTNLPDNVYNTSGELVSGAVCNRSYPGNELLNGRVYCYYATGKAQRNDPYDPDEIYYRLTNNQFVETSPSINVTQDAYNHTITINYHGGSVAGNVYGGSNASGNVYGNVFVNLHNGTLNSVYGGGRGQSTDVHGDITIKTMPTDNTTLTVTNIYGGSALGAVNNSGVCKVTIDGGTFQTIYGGGEGSNNVAARSLGAINVEFNSGTADEVYNGNNVRGTPSGPLNVTINGGTIKNVFGGSKGQLASTIDTDVVIAGGTIDNVYGGGNAAPTTGSSHVTIAQGSGKTVTITGYTGAVNSDGDPIYGGVYGSGKGSTAYVADANVDVGVGSFTVKADNSDGASVFGGGYQAGTDSGSGNSGTTTVNINSGATVYNVFGGSNQAGTVHEATVNANAGTFSGNLYGGGNVATTRITHLNLVGSTSTNIVSDDVANAPYGNGFGGGKSADVTTSNVEFKGMTLNNVYGGSNQNGLVTNSNVLASYGTCENVFGGNNAGGSTLHTSVVVDEDSSHTLTVTNVYGGSNGSGAYIGARNRDLNPSTYGSTLVEFKKGSISGNVFGGGNSAVVYGDTVVNMYDGTVNSIYGAGNMAHVGNYDTAYDPSPTPYTGEYNVHTSYVESDRTSTVNISGGTINGNVFGSGNAAFIHGDTYVNVGKSAYDALSSNGATIKNISITGTVFGGSYTNASEGTSYEFDSIGVVGHTHINLDSTDYYSNNKSIITIRGSVYGEGNNSTITGSGSDLATIDIINYGNNDNPVTFASVARASRVNILDSHIELTGARNKQFFDDKSEYSFVTINNLYLLGTYNTSNPGGTTVYAKGGGTYLYKMYSGYLNGSGTYIKEQVDENFNPIGVDNRIYMPSRKVLVVNQGKINVGAPGTVHGIAFLGMYKHTDDGIIRGIYDPDYSTSTGYVDDATYDLFDPTANFTYVYGSSTDDGNNPLVYIEDENGVRRTTIDGFWTNYASSEDKSFSTNYVGVKPKTEPYYKWMIGEEVLEIVVDLKASKYSMEASKNADILFDDLYTEDGQSNGDVIFKINRIDSSEFGTTITNSTIPFRAELLDKVNIPKIAETYDENGVIDANRFFALSMGTTSNGWKSNYSTNIYSDQDQPYTGDTEYVYDSTTGARSLSFWLYHSKNIDTDLMEDEDLDIGLGHVSVDMVARNPNWGDATPDVTIVVTINAYLTNDADHDGYGYSIAPGKKYSTFASSTPTIGTNGSFSIYHSLSLDLTKPVAGKKDEYWSAERAYDDDNYRYLASKDKLPAGTRITMIDMITGEYYFYEVTGNEPQNMNGSYSYYLTDFISMSNVGGDRLHFDDDMNAENSKYYHEIGDSKYAIEEFIFTFDFSSTDQNSYPANYQKTSNIYLELDGVDDDTGNTITILTPVFETDDSAMNYTVLKTGDSHIVTDGGFVKDDGTINPSDVSYDLYKQTPATVSLITSLQNETNNPRFTDTIFNDYQLGAKLTFYKIENGNRVALSYDTLDGLVVNINGKNYYPENSESYGVIRLNLAGRISTLESLMKLDFSNVTDSFVVGDYQLCVETFGSYDGLYYNGVNTTEKCFDFNLLSNEFGLEASAPSSQITHDVVTGLDSEGNDTITYTVRSVNGLAHPVMKIAIQSLKSHSGNVYSDIIYENKDICDFATSIEITGEGKETVTIDCTSADRTYYYDLGAISNQGLTEYTVTVVLKHGPNEEETNPMTSGWRSGTYRVMFTVFDRITTNGIIKDTSIGSDYEYLIIRSLDVDEYRNGG